MENSGEQLVHVEEIDNEPSLVVDEQLLEEAMAESNNPELLQQTLDRVVASINKKADDYLDISIMDKGEFDADKENAEAGMEAIADKLNKAFANFQENEKVSTDTMLNDIRQIDSKVADILYDYRDPTLWESARWLAYWGISKDKFIWNMKSPGTKRVNN